MRHAAGTSREPANAVNGPRDLAALAAGVGQAVAVDADLGQRVNTRTLGICVLSPAPRDLAAPMHICPFDDNDDARQM
jgi:hypothetical protein